MNIIISLLCHWSDNVALSSLCIVGGQHSSKTERLVTQVTGTGFLWLKVFSFFAINTCHALKDQMNIIIWL